MATLFIKKYDLFSKILFVLALCILGCDGTGNQQINREAISKAIEQQEVKRILPAELVEAAHAQGEAIAAQAQEIAVDAYQAEANHSGDFLTGGVQEKIDSLAKARKAEIRWIPADVDSTKVALSDLEQQIWEAYWYNVENDLPVNDNVQKINEEAYLYTSPMMLDAELRKKLPGSEDSTDAQGFLGMWSIRLSKRAIVQSM